MEGSGPLAHEKAPDRANWAEVGGLHGSRYPPRRAVLIVDWETRSGISLPIGVRSCRYFNSLAKGPIIVFRNGFLSFPFYQPCLPTISRSAPTGSQWAYEIKHDGFRFICRRDGDRLRVLSRWGIDHSDRAPVIAEALLALSDRLPSTVRVWSAGQMV